MSLIVVWVIYTSCGIAAFSAAFAWAVRTRQFSELDRQRYMALRVDDPPDAQTPGPTPSRIDRYATIGLPILALAVFTWVICLGIRFR